MGHVAMAGLDFLIILDPFLNSVVALTDLDRGQFAKGIFQPGREILVFTEQIGSLDACTEEFGRDFDIHCC